MKLITYETYGSLIPDAVLKKNKSLGGERVPGSLMHSQDLVAFIESFASNPVVDEKTIRDNPDKLFYIKETSKNGITTRSFYGWHTTDNGYGCVARVGVNEYDETVTHVIFGQYDGSEFLEPVPEYAPVEGVPGLYQEVRK